jgi:enamine deaminase RidA (YjgF/YER057c/UK114 family)
VQNVEVALRAAGAAHPAETIVGITGLAVSGCLIEIECTAVLG